MITMVTCYQRNKMRRALPELAFEVIIEILSWLPVESLLRFKCVCKEWCSLIRDNNFIAKHMKRASLLSYQYKLGSNNKVITVCDGNFNLSAHFAGLFLEMSVTNSGVCRIRNPATRQVLYLPKPDAHEGSHRMDFALNSVIGECKVVCHYMKNGDRRKIYFKVITIGKDEQWRPLKHPNQNLLEDGKRTLKRYYLRACNAEGVAHFSELTTDGRQVYLEVHSLDLWSECFTTTTTTTLPRGVFPDLNKVQVFSWKRHLAVADIAKEALNVLVLRDLKWSKKKIVVPLKFLKDDPADPLMEDQILPLRAYSTGLLRLRTAEKNLVYYDMKRKTVTYTLKIGENSVSRYKPSLLTLKGMRPEAEMGTLIVEQL